MKALNLLQRSYPVVSKRLRLYFSLINFAIVSVIEDVKRKVLNGMSMKKCRNYEIDQIEIVLMIDVLMYSIPIAREN